MVDDVGVGVGVGLDGSVSGLLGWLVVGFGGVVTGFVLGCRFGVLVFVGVGLGWAWVVLVTSVTCCWLVFCWLLCGRLCLVSVFWVFVFWLGWLLGCWRWFGFKILGMSFTLDNIGCRMVGGGGKGGLVLVLVRVGIGVVGVVVGFCVRLSLPVRFVSCLWVSNISVISFCTLVPSFFLLWCRVFATSA